MYGRRTGFRGALSVMARSLMHGASLPRYARRVIEALERAGFEAWVVGGWVRDTLRGAEVHDLDVTTSAPWQRSAETLRAAGMTVHETGVAHGTVTVVCEGRLVEVTTYRVEGAYSDHRHPDSVRFVSDVREDLARRDFTINAMAWHPERGLLDPYGGAADLERKTIRAVGDPRRRFDEDALRILRAVRFSSRMGFAIEPETQRALREQALSLQDVAPERIGQELNAIVCGGWAGTALLEQPEVMCVALPELAAARGFDQRSVYHVYDVYEHIAHVCRACQAFTAGLAAPALQWAALLHDVAKPATFSLDVAGHGHFFDHPRQGAEMAADVLRRLAMPSALVNQVRVLIRWHDEPMPATRQAIHKLLVRLERACPGKAVPLAYMLFDLRRADAVSKCPDASSWASELDRYTKILRELAAESVALSVRQLAVDGSDVMRTCNVAPGPGVGMYLDVLMQAVLEGAVPNERRALLDWLGAGS